MPQRDEGDYDAWVIAGNIWFGIDDKDSKE